MEKHKISIHAFTVHIYSIAIGLLVLLLIVLGLKYLHLKLAVKGYTDSTIWMNQQLKPNGFISDYGLIIAQAATTLPASDLQNYVSTLSKTLNRDIVVMDQTKKILADTVVANIGTIYDFDKNDEIKMTITDGQYRSFEERSTDYPSGVLEIVVPMKNGKGEITGVVLVSNSLIK